MKELSDEFHRRMRTYESLEEEALFILEVNLKKADIKLHSISSRIKKLESFLDKVQRKQSERPFEEIQDVVGVRVVCLFLSDINRIGALIRDSFLVVSEDNKVEGTDVSSFGYMSVHFIVTMKKEHTGPRYDHISGLPFEIQVRTIAMDAWANVSHYLDYKTEEDVPNDLKRDFYALSGLFYVADKHFEMFYGARRQSQEEMIELFEGATPQAKAEQEINLDSMTAYLHKRFPDRDHGESKSVSSLISELLEAGYKSIGDIERIVENTWDAFILYENEDPPNSGRYSDVGVVRTSAKLWDDDYLRIAMAHNYEDEAERRRSFSRNQQLYEKYRNMLKK
jgi:ppGpp synthetase/RelA/SpoT-type nucleotidyltranferase